MSTGIEPRVPRCEHAIVGICWECWERLKSTEPPDWREKLLADCESVFGEVEYALKRITEQHDSEKRGRACYGDNTRFCQICAIRMAELQSVRRMIERLVTRTKPSRSDVTTAPHLFKPEKPHA